MRSRARSVSFLGWRYDVSSCTIPEFRNVFVSFHRRAETARPLMPAARFQLTTCVFKRPIVIIRAPDWDRGKRLESEGGTRISSTVREEGSPKRIAFSTSRAPQQPVRRHEGPTTMPKKPQPPRREAGTSSANQFQDISPCDLLLDPQNPRLPEEEHGSTQADLLRIMIDRFKIDELAESIVSIGFTSFDPIVTYRSGDGIIVLEGNRRVATLQLLLNPSLAPQRHQERWRNLSKELPSDVRKDISRINVSIYDDRTHPDVIAYIGFRHVTGVLKWPALEKARYVADLVDNHQWSFAAVAQRLGSYPKHIERHYVAYRLVRQAVHEESPGSDRMEAAFGVLMRAIQAAGVVDFLGLSFPGDPARSKKPISRQRLPAFKEFVVWAFGTDQAEPVLKDSRDVTKFGQILGSAEALGYLRTATRPTIQRAWFKSGGELDGLVETLRAAADRLEEGLPFILDHKDDPDVLDAAMRCARAFVQILPHFPSVSERYNLKLSAGN